MPPGAGSVNPEGLSRPSLASEVLRSLDKPSGLTVVAARRISLKISSVGRYFLENTFSPQAEAQQTKENPRPDLGIKLAELPIVE